MCSENTPLRLTNGVLGVFFIMNSIKIVLKRVGCFVKQTNDNLTIIDDLKKDSMLEEHLEFLIRKNSSTI